MNEIDKMIDGYYRWLRDKTQIKHLKDWAEITTPYLDRHNDYIQIYVRTTEKGFLLTDSGETILDLEHSGCKIDSPKRQEILRNNLLGFGIEYKNNELFVHTTKESFALKKHNLIQAIISIGDMFYLSATNIESMFFEDVAIWLDLADIRYTPRVKFPGKTGFDHVFDFVIPKSRAAPERIIRQINNPNRTTSTALIMAWVDTKTSRPPQSRSFAFLNDTEKTNLTSVAEALHNYEITPVVWSQREHYREQLAA